MVQSGVAKVEIFVSAYAEATGFWEAGALATTRQATIELAEKAVTVSSSKDPTWRKGPAGARILNAVTDITDVRGDTAVTLFRSPLGLLWGQQSIRYDRTLWGQWVSPYNEWWYPYTTPEGFWQSAYDHDTLTSEVEWVVQDLTFSNQSLINLVQGNAQSVSTSVTVTNNGGSGTARSAQYTMWVHSPVESPAITSENREYGSWIRCSPIYQRNPGDQPMTFTMELSISHSVTVTLSAGGTLDAELVNFSLNLAIGATAEIRHATGVQYTFGPVFTDRPTYHCIKRQAFWNVFEGVYDAYAESGYDNQRAFTGRRFASGSKAAAEANDYIEQQFYSDDPNEL